MLVDWGKHMLTGGKYDLFESHTTKKIWLIKFVLKKH